MNKKGVIKLSVFALIFSVVLVLTFSLFFSSAVEPYSESENSPKEEITYSLGEILDFSEYESCYLKIKTPSKELREKCPFSLKLDEPGKYIIDIESEDSFEKKSFLVSGNVEETFVEKDTSLIQERAEINKPVRWTKKISDEEKNFTLPKNSEIQNSTPEEIIYETPAPTSDEIIFSENEKEIIVSSPDEIHYENILSYTNISEKLSVSQEDLIKIYWKENNTYLPFTAKDTNENGLIDYVEWIIPHLSTQTFEIIIITKAEHLDSNKNFISNLYEEVKELDGIWSETISSGEFIRVSFELNLTDKNDITLFPRIISGNPSIEVYEKNKERLVATFENITSNEYNKIYLTNLIGEQSDFDLKIIDGEIEFNHIIDPWINESWNKRKSITVSSSAISSSLNNFPMLVELYDSDLKNFARSDGNDIFFTDVNDNKLSHEIELFDSDYNSTHAHLVAWVKVNLSSSSDNLFWMYYNNSGSSAQQSPYQVWDSNYMTVQHLEESSGTGNFLLDSTSNANNGTPAGTTPTYTSAKFNGGYSLSGNNQQRIEIPDTASLQRQTFTAEGWAIANSWTTPDHNPIFWKGTQLGWGANYMFRIAVSSGAPTWGVTCGTTEGYFEGGTVSLGQWYYYTITFDGTTTTAYINGQSVATSTTCSGQTINVHAGSPIRAGFGYRETASEQTHFDGTLDELRFSNISRSADWINATYNNYNYPSGFYSVGVQEEFGVVPPSPPIYIRTGTVSYGGGAAAAITFSASMPNTNYSTLFSGQQDSDSVFAIEYLNKAAAGFSVQAEDDGGAAEAAGIEWAAISHGEYNFGNMLIKCGTRSGTSTSTTNFATAFPNTSYAIISYPITDSNSPRVSYSAKTANSWSAVILEDTGAAEEVTSIDWCAVSYGTSTIGGTTIKSGYNTTAATGTTTKIISLGSAFPNTNYIVLTTSLRTGTNDPCEVEVSAKTTTTFSITAEDDDTTNNCGNREFNWVAISAGEADLSLDRIGVTINSPSDGSTISDPTPYLNFTTNATANSIFYNLGNQNISVCSDECPAGNYVLPLLIKEGASTISVYAIADVNNASNSVDVSLDLDYNFFDSFEDNSSVLSLNGLALESESVSFPSSPLAVFSDNFENDLSQWETTAWDLSTVRYHDGRQSVLSSNNNEGNLDSLAMNTSQTEIINVSFWYNEDDLEDADVDIYFRDSSNNWDLIDSFGADQATEDQWFFKSYTTTDTQYLHSNFAIRFNTVLDDGENVWLDEIVTTLTYFNGELISVPINLSSNLVEFTNISWNTEDSDEDNIRVQVSADNGTTWHNATNGQDLTEITIGSNLIYRVLFSRESAPEFPSLLDINISWTDQFSPPPSPIINSPSGTIQDLTPVLNVSIDDFATSLRYSINGKANITLCENCSAGDYTSALRFDEETYVISVYTASRGNSTLMNSTTISVDLNYNYFDSFEDTSLISQVNKAQWYQGNVTFVSSFNPFSDNFENDLSQWETTAWDLSTVRYHDGRQSVLSSNNNEGNLDSLAMNTSQTEIINVSFWYNEQSLEDADVDIYFRDSSNNWDLIDSFGSDEAVENIWYPKTYTTNDPQYLHSNFAIRFNTVLGAGENIWFDEIDVTALYGGGNFTSYSVNLSSSITEFTNISWEEEGTDEENKITLQVSTDNGTNWYDARNGQNLLGIISGNKFLYRVLFSATQPDKIISISSVNISWSDHFAPTPNVTINSPDSGTISDVTPVLNVSIDGPATSLFYKINNQQSITICTDCYAGDYSTFLHLAEGAYSVTVYATDILNNQKSDSVSFTVELNNNYYENFEDNSSLLENQTYYVEWQNGKMNFSSSLFTIFSENFENDLSQWATTTWDLSTARYHQGTQSVLSSNNNEGNFDSNAVDTSQSSFINVSFWYNEQSLEDADVDIYFRDRNNNWDMIESFGSDNTPENQWYFKSYSTTDTQYLHSNFAIRFNTVLGAGENIWLDEINISLIPTQGNFTAYPLGVSETITSITNISWEEEGTDEENNLSVEFSIDNGETWHSAIKNQGMPLMETGSNLIYRVLFITSSQASISFSNFNIIWSDEVPSIVNISINSPTELFIADVTPKLNISTTEIANALWYNINSGANTTICSPCSPGEFSKYLYLSEGDFNLSVYANNSAGVLSHNFSNFTIELNNNYYENFDDNSSLLGNQTNDVSWNPGLINFFISNTTLFSENFENDLSQWATTTWDLSTARYHQGTQSVLSSNNNEGNFDSNAVDTSQSSFINVSFWYNEQSLEDADVDIYFRDRNNNWDMIESFGSDNTPENQWYFKSYSTTDTQYLHSNFAIRFNTVLGAGENIWLDEINITNDAWGNFTAYPINVIDVITSITNISWESSGDSVEDILEIELSLDGGNTWLDANENQQISSFTPSNVLSYRALFSTRSPANISLSDINISWSSAPTVEIIYPVRAIYPSLITQLNFTAVSGGGLPASCWWSNNSGITNYTIPCNQNITTQSIEGTNIWTVYASDSGGVVGYDSVNFTVDISAPEIIFINQTDEENEIITESNPIERGQNMTINIEVIDEAIDSVWVVIWQGVIGGAQMMKVFFTNIGGFLWSANITTDSTEEGTHNYTIYTNDTGGMQSDYDGNFSVLDLSSSLGLNPSTTDGTGNVTISGTLNYSNGTSLSNYPINLWQNGTLLQLSNVTSIGSYSNNQNKIDTSSSDFLKGEFQNTVDNSGEIILSSGYSSGNYTKILDAGARVDWNSISWNYVGQSCATTLSWQDEDSDFFGTYDVYVDGGSANANYGEDELLLVDTSPTQRALLKFDVIGNGGRKIPYNSTISSATISINIEDPTADLVSVYEILESWEESQVTYNSRFAGTQWGSAGVANTPSRSLILESSFSPTTAGTSTFSILNAMRNWVNGTRQNYGVVLSPGGSNTLGFSSSENSIQENRPMLTVSFSSSDCTNIVMQVRFSNDKNIWTNWTTVSNASQLSDGNIQYRYMQYRAELGAADSTLTPHLTDITANYAAIVTDSEGKYSYNISSPTSFGSHLVKMNTSLRTMFTEVSSLINVQTGMAPNVSLTSPSTEFWFNSSEIILTYNATDLNDDLVLAELIINKVVNETNSTPIINFANNNFTITLPPGKYNWTVNLTDNTGYKATTPERTFYIDLENPVVNLIFPEDESSYSASSLNLTFIATDNMDSNLTCDITLDGAVIHNDIQAENSTNLNYSTGPLSSGEHIWNVTCFDNSMRSASSPERSFTIVDLPPSVALISPENNYYNSNGEISFEFNVTEDIGMLNCSLILNGNNFASNQSEIILNGQNQINVSGLSEGRYNWTIGCYDTNLNYFQNASLRNLTVDLNFPTINLNLPENIFTSSNSSVNFNFTVNDSMDSSLSCNITIDGEVFDGFNATSGILTNRKISNLTDGEKEWNVVCSDDALHVTESDTRTITIAEPPRVSVKTTNRTFFPSSFVAIEYTPSDNTGFSECRIYLNGIASESNSSEILNSEVNEIEITGLPDGTYNYYINCTDTFSLSSSSPANTFYVDQNAPIVNLIFPLNEIVFATNITFNFTALDEVDDSLICNLFVDEENLASNLTATNGTMINKTISGISDGLHSWYVECFDNSSNRGESPSYNFTKSTAPDIALVSPANNSWVNSSPFNLTYYLQDDEGFLISYLIIDGEIYTTNSTELISYSENNFLIEGFSERKYNWTVIATDKGNINGTTQTNIFYLDLTPPSITLNSPENLQLVETNNVSLNYSVFDNLDGNIFCQLYLDDSPEDSSNVTNSSNKVIYQLIPDGEHSWFVRCFDEAGNSQQSETKNFTVEAPPRVELLSPANETLTTDSMMNLTYVPYDPIGITRCNLIFDDEIKDSSVSISPNQNNSFLVENIEEGLHNWTVNCSDPDDNWNWSIPRIFSRDITPPTMILNSPANNSILDMNSNRVYFNWTTYDVLDNELRCNLTVDGIVRETIPLWINGTSQRKYVLSSDLGLGEHFWNTTCWDRMNNTNTSETRKFILTYPDFSVNNSEIFFNNSNPKEGELIEITATIRNFANLTATNLLVGFYDGNTSIKNSSINISEFGIVNVSTNLISKMGHSEISVLVDPPIATNGTFKELNESNNIANTSWNVGSWHFFYGDVLTLSSLILADNETNKIINWSADGIESGNVYVADYESTISWTSLQSIGKTTLGAGSSYDFSEIDNLLNSSSYYDSVYSLYTNDGSPKQIQNISVFDSVVQGVPVINSINNSNFITGILWDTSDDSNGEFGVDKEDLIFVAPVNKYAEGTFGTYDYEIRVPAKLREYYKEDDSRSAAFYLELA